MPLIKDNVWSNLIFYSFVIPKLARGWMVLAWIDAYLAIQHPF